MVSDTKIDEVLGYVRLVLPLMSKHDIPITPRNYTIWYNHVSGVNAALSKAIESIIAERTGFTEQKNDMLYRQFCMEKDDSELLRIRDNLRQIMATVLRQMAELTGRNDEYDAFISNSITQLSNADMDDIAYPSSHYTHRVVSLAVRIVVEDGLPYRAASWHLWRDHRVFVPWATIQNWVEASGKKSKKRYKH